MKKHAWLVALMFLAGSLVVGGSSAAHAATPGPYVDLAVDRSLTNPGVWIVSYTAHAWGANVSAHIQSNGVTVAHSLATTLFSSVISVPSSDCDSFKLYASDGSQAIHHTVRVGDVCDGALAEYNAPFGASSRGARPVDAGLHRSAGELRSGGILSAPAASLSPAPDSWSQNTVPDRVGVTLWHASPWCGTMVLHGISNTLLGGETPVGAELTHGGDACLAHAPPVVDLGPDQTKRPKGAFVLEGIVTDPDTANHVVLIDWGDGNSDTAHSVGGVFSMSHDFGGKGTWTITACASDAQATACDSMQLIQGSGGGSGGKDGGGKGDGGKPDKGGGKGDGHPGKGKK